MAPPLWQQISDTLTSEIRAGRYPAGTRLPSEATMADRFGVNRHTVRRALGVMANAGLVHPRRGAGVFVTGAQISYRVGRQTRFSQNLAEAGHAGSRRILRIETLPASIGEARALEIAAGAPVHVVEALAAADGVPVSHAIGVFPAARFADLPAALTANPSVTAALEAAGVPDYRRRSTRLAAVLARGATARHLRLPDGAPLLRTRAINVDAEARPVEFGTTWFAADRVELLVDEESFA